MKLVELKQAQKTAVTNLKKRRFDLLEFYTFKKDRSVTIKLTEDSARLVETGYKELDIELNDQNAKRQIKTSFGREFPRSHKVYFSSSKAKRQSTFDNYPNIKTKKDELS